MTKYLFLGALTCLGITGTPVFASEGGYSNYVPGFYGDIAIAVEPEPGFALRNDIYFYSADGGDSVRSGRVEFEAELDMTLDYLSLLYKTEQKVFGAGYAFGATLIVGNIDIDGSLALGPLATEFSDDKTSYGDITLIPGIFYWNYGDKLHFSQAFYIVAPISDYDKNNLVNIGLNYWTFETDFSMTYLDQETGQDYSVVIGYGYNTKNDDTDYQSGDEWHIDYAINQFLTESLAVGVHGFYFQQISGDSGGGAVLGDFKAQAAGIGPALMWVPPQFNGDVALVGKWIHEFDSENRMQGDHVFLSFMMSF